MRHAVALALAVLAGSWLAPPAALASERIDLKPDERAGWSPSNLLAFLRGGYYFEERTVEIETTPPGATLDLFYVRASFQKRYEQAEAPVTLVLPRRIEATKRDSVTIRAYLPGHRIETVHVPVRGKQEQVHIDLAPLPNTLAAVSHTYFAGRSGLSLLMSEPVTARVQDGGDGFTVILGETARGAEVQEVLEGLRSPQLDRIEVQQLGEDLLLRVQLAPDVSTKDFELRSRQGEDGARDLHRFTIDLVPTDRGAAAVESARAALARIDGGDVGGCATAFDRGLRAALDREQLARALTPRGDFTDPFLRAALRRLGEVSPGGVIRLEDGSRYRPGVPLELAAAASQAASAESYLALLRRWVELLEPPPHRAEALRSLVAPEMQPSAFESALERARAAERRCAG